MGADTSSSIREPLVQTERPELRISRRLVSSHVWLAIGLASVASLIVWAVLFRSEDAIYRRLLEHRRDQDANSLFRRIPESQWDAALRDACGVRRRGPFELERDGLECHGIIHEEEDGSRSVLLLQIPEEESEATLFLWLIGGTFCCALCAVALGSWMARRSLAPALRLADSLQSADILSASGLSTRYDDDEIGFLARRLEQYVHRHEAVLERERVFLRDASHELRTPLSVLRGALELALQEGGESPKHRPRLERMDRAARRMQSAVETLLWMARQEREFETSEARPLSDSVKALLEDFVLCHRGLLGLEWRSTGAPGSLAGDSPQSPRQRIPPHGIRRDSTRNSAGPCSCQ